MMVLSQGDHSRIGRDTLLLLLVYGFSNRMPVHRRTRAWTRDGILCVNTHSHLEYRPKRQENSLAKGPSNTRSGPPNQRFIEQLPLRRFDGMSFPRLNGRNTNS